MRVTLIVRRTHLFIGLFLAPWITMYAVSTLVMHHRVLFTGLEERATPAFVKVSERPYELDPAVADSATAAARRILADAGLSGAHETEGTPRSVSFIVSRYRATGTDRLTYDADAKTLTQERQPFGLALFLEMLHRRHGFQQSYLVNDLWAVIVDVVIAAIVVWAISGIWMWLQLPGARRFGTACLALGSAAFAYFLLRL